MTQLYKAHGIQFRYPDEWTVQEQEQEAETSIAVHSPGAAFWSVTLFPHRPQPAELVESAVAAFQDEYPEMDVYEAQSSLCQRPTLARDIDFVCMDLIGSAYLRAFRTGRFSALVLYQGLDAELQTARQPLEQISQSLLCEFGDDVLL